MLRVFSHKIIYLLLSALSCLLLILILQNQLNDDNNGKLAGHHLPNKVWFGNSLSNDRSNIENNNENINSNHEIIIYNRIPKTGSTSFINVAYDLCRKNSFNVIHINVTRNSHVLSLADQARFVNNVTNWNQRKPALYHGHMGFIDFSRFGFRRPIYINILRDPLDRLISYYYFLRYGDDFRPYLLRSRHGNKLTFDECVERKEQDCHPSHMWLQVPFLCGQSSSCWVPGNEWALEEAKRNLINQYLLVGVTEEITNFISVLEAVIPSFFNGATKHFISSRKKHLRKTNKKIEPSERTRAEIKKSVIWKMEHELYEFALQQFHYVKNQMLINTNGTVQDKGTQFKFEKIYPK